MSAVDYLHARAALSELHASFTEMFEQRYDAILTPTASGTAPAGTRVHRRADLLRDCGRSAGMPALSVPIMHGANGLPLGVQLVGPRHADARLLRTARWLVAHVERDQ